MMGKGTAPVVSRAREGEIIETVIGGIAEVNGEDILEVETLLYDVLDPDSLDRIFRDIDGEWQATKESYIEFSMCGCHVLVLDTGHVVVTGE